MIAAAKQWVVVVIERIVINVNIRVPFCSVHSLPIRVRTAASTAATTDATAAATKAGRPKGFPVVASDVREQADAGVVRLVCPRRIQLGDD